MREPTMLIEGKEWATILRPDDDGKAVWLPSAQFDASFEEEEFMSFAQAMHYLEMSVALSRDAWDDQAWIVRVRSGGYTLGITSLRCAPGKVPPRLADWVGICHKGRFTPWAPTQEDMSAGDWRIVHPDQE
jgi:hypothetical protein